MGWIRLHRNILEHWIFQDPAYLQAWITILLTVNYEPKKVLIRNSIIECGRGQSVLSLHSWVERLGVNHWSLQKVRTFFDLLQKDNMVILENLKKTTRLTVCNYERYQEQQHIDNTQPTYKQHAANTHLTTTKEREEIIIKTLGENFIEPVSLWLKYKSEKKQNYKETGFVSFLKQLGKISNNDPNVAMMIIEHSMANNYSGLFPPKGKTVTQTANVSYR